MGFLWFLLIGLCAGWLAGQLVKGGGFGIVGDMIVGVIGALLGGFLFGLLGLAAVGLLGQLITATVGAVVFILILRAIKRADDQRRVLPTAPTRAVQRRTRDDVFKRRRAQPGSAVTSSSPHGMTFVGISNASPLAARTVGGWTDAQIITHCAIVMEMALDGFNFSARAASVARRLPQETLPEEWL